MIWEGRREDLLLQLGLLLLLLTAAGRRHARVGRTLEDVLPVDGALAERRPALGVVVVAVLGLRRGGGDPVLQRAEVVQDLCHTGSPVRVHYMVALSATRSGERGEGMARPDSSWARARQAGGREGQDGMATGASIGEWEGEYGFQRTSVHSSVVSGGEIYIRLVGG